MFYLLYRNKDDNEEDWVQVSYYSNPHLKSPPELEFKLKDYSDGK